MTQRPPNIDGEKKTSRALAWAIDQSAAGQRISIVVKGADEAHKLSEQLRERGIPAETGRYAETVWQVVVHPCND